MKYAIIFLLVFLCGLGLLQLLDKEDESIQPELSEVPVNISDSSSLNSKPTENHDAIEEDTTSYKVVDNHYEILWSHLSKVDFEERFNEDMNVMIPYPVFHPSVKKLAGKKIQIKGYVIPFEETGDETIVILSAFPFSSCFFCGGAGAETVMDVQMKKKSQRFKQDAMTTFRGKLRLNDSDLDYLNYILDDAEVVN